MIMNDITVLGGGNGACAIAAHLALRGFNVTLFELPEFESHVAGIREAGGLELRSEIPGMETGFARLKTVTTHPQEGLSGVRLVWAPLPAYAQGPFATICAPYLTRDHIIVLTPGGFGGAVEFTRVLRGNGLQELPTIVEAETMIYAAYKVNSTTVRISGRKRNMAVAAFPAIHTDTVFGELLHAYADLIAVESTLETGLRNPNTILHVPIVLANLTRIESGGKRFHFYRDGVAGSVSHIIRAVDRERMAIGRALGLTLPSLHDMELTWYGHQGARGETIEDLIRHNPAYADILAPQKINHRYFTEDVPYGLVPWESLGAFVDVPTPVISSLINFSNAVLGCDFRAEGRSLATLGLQRLNLAQLKAYFANGL